MANVFPPASYVDITPKDALKIKRTLQGTAASTMCDVLNHQVDYRFLRSTTKTFQESVSAASLRFESPNGYSALDGLTYTPSPRATQLWVWVDCVAGVAAWESKTYVPYVNIRLYDTASTTLIDTGYNFRAIDGTLTEQFTGFADAGLWDQRFLFSGDRTDPGDGAPRRLDIPAAYKGNELYIQATLVNVRLRSLTVIEAFQPVTPQES